MGSEKTTQTTDQKASTQYTPTAEETAINKLDLERRQGQQGGLMANDQAGLNLSSAFLQGKDLPGYFKGLPYGISPEVTTGIVDQSLRDMNVQLAHSGAGTYMESGAAQAIGARTAGDIRQSAEQFNLGQLLNLLNLATGSSAQIQQPMNQNAATFSGRLAGLRSSASFGNQTQTTLGMNPFLKSFQTGMGSYLGGGMQTAAMGAV
jgi:hypothetical protein